MKKNMILIVMGIFFSFCFLSVTFADTSNTDINQIDIVEPYVHVSSQSYIDTYFSWYFAKINNYTTYAQFKINPDFLADTKNITAISTSNQVTTYCNKWLNLTNGSLALSNCNATSVTTLKSNVLNLTTVKNYPLINLTTNIGFSNFTYNASSGIGDFYISFPKGMIGNESAKLGFGTVLVDSTASSGDFPCIALDSNGYVYIAHTAGTVVRQCNNTLGWACSQIDANGSLGNGIGCAMDNQNVFHVMYRDGGNTTWRYWNNSAVEIRYAMILGYVPAYASLAIDSLNNKHFVFDNYTGSRQAVYCNATALTNTFSTCSKPDSTGNAGEYIQVTVNSTNNAQVVFLRATSGTLRYCNITSGSTWTCRSLGTGAGYGTYPTISVRNDQSIVIVSVNITGTDSMLLWNNSINARNTWNEYILAYGASVQYTSVAVDYANNTHVIWFNATTNMAYLNVTNGFTVKATARYAGTNTGGQCMGSCIAIKKGNEGNFSNSYDTTAHFAYRNSTLNYDNMTGLPSSAPPPAGTAWNVSTNDTLNITDITDILIGYKKSATDSLIWVEKWDTQRNYSKLYSDVLTIIENISKRVGFTKAYSDIITTVEKITSAFGYSRSTSDIVNLVESIAKYQAFRRSSGDIITILDTVTKRISLTKTAGDIITTVEKIISSFGYARNAGDILTGYDSISTSKGYIRTQTDIITIIETRIVTFSATRSKSDTMLISDNINRLFGVGRSFSDILTISDYITRKLTATDIIKEYISTTESILKYASFPRNVYNTISIVENITKLQLRIRNIYDIIIITQRIDMTTTGFSLINIIMSNRDADAFVRFNWTISGGTAPFSYNATLYKTDNLSRVVYSVITTSNSYKFIGLNGSTNYTVVVNATDSTGKTSQLNLTARSEAILVSWEIGIPIGIFAMAFFLIYVAVNLMPKREGLQALFWVSSLFVIYGGIDIMAKIATENGELGIASILNSVNGGYIWIIVLVIAYLLISFLVEQLRALGKIK